MSYRSGISVLDHDNFSFNCSVDFLRELNEIVDTEMTSFDDMIESIECDDQTFTVTTTKMADLDFLSFVCSNGEVQTVFDVDGQHEILNVISNYMTAGRLLFAVCWEELGFVKHYVVSPNRVQNVGLTLDNGLVYK